MVGASHLYFYDAISPIVLAESIDRAKVFRASRWGRNIRGLGVRRGSAGFCGVPVAGFCTGPAPACGVDDGEGDYLNCPFTREEYQRFYDALVAAERAPLHEFDEPRFFEGCLPIEVMASRGVDTLRFGPMKPVGLVDPRTGREAFAIVQLRQDNLAGDHFSLVGFQTQMKWGEQARVLKLIPGLEAAEFVRFGMIHRNTYINGPTVLRETWQTRSRDDLFFAGQISGVEGYVESAASGLLAGRNAAALSLGTALRVPPRTTAIGAMAYYVSNANPKHYQPTNITFGIMPPLEPEGGRRPPRKKADRNAALSARALAALRAGSQARRDGAPGAMVTAGRRRMKQHVRDFLEHLHLNENASLHTVRAYESDLDQFITFLAQHLGRRRPDVAVADFQHLHIRAFLGDLHKRGNSRASAARKLAALRSFGRYLRREGEIEGIPAHSWARPSASIACPRISLKRKCRVSSKCPTPRRRSAAATAPSSSCSMPRGFASASLSASASKTSI